MAERSAPVKLNDDERARSSAAAEYGIRFAAQKQGLNLHTYDVGRLAEAAVAHAIDAGVVPEHQMSAAVEKVKRSADVNLRRACAAEVARDHLLVRVQAVLTEHAAVDRETAVRLASDLGVILHLESADE